MFDINTIMAQDKNEALLRMCQFFKYNTLVLSLGGLALQKIYENVLQVIVKLHVANFFSTFVFVQNKASNQLGVAKLVTIFKAVCSTNYILSVYDIIIKQQLCCLNYSVV
jgi:ABC-type polysaccharide transport system permease subunit